ncbi:nucleoplasmin-2 isoform X12 [Callithrix jacchus]
MRASSLQLRSHPAPPPRAMNLSSTSSTEEKAVTTVLWGCELSQERRTWTFRPQPKGKQDCKLLLHTVTMVGVQLSPPITFQLRAGSGPVFLSGHERYEMSDLTWEEEEEEEGEEDEEEEEEEDDEDEDVDISLEEESPVKQGKRLVPQKPTSVAKKKKLEKEQEEVRPKPYPDPKSQDSRNEELRLGGHDAEWAFPGLCCREGAPLPHPCICLNVTAVLWGQHKSPSPPTLHFQEAPSKDPRLWSQ